VTLPPHRPHVRVVGVCILLTGAIILIIQHCIPFDPVAEPPTGTDLLSFLPVTGEYLDDLEAGLCRRGPD
jgi:hypothetical protein